LSRNVLADSIESVGLAIAFQYGLTGFACVWYHRKILTRSVKDLVFKGVLPGLGALSMLLLFLYATFVVYADPRYGTTAVDLPLFGRTGGVTVLGLGALLIGFLLMPVVTRGHSVALKLQRSLLPRRLPPHAAVDSASRYLPADSGSGVGGDWYDVIPLSGTRVGLVVGDVLGHGMHAAATVGRLRTGVRVLARLDLSPDELLSRLADLVEQTSHEGEPGRGPGHLKAHADAALGVSCLYAVYDPVSGQCSMARAGEPVLALVEPHTGVVDYPQLPPGPPLGIGGLPYQSKELELAPGTVVALFTDGLLQAAADREAGLAQLSQVLSDGRRSLEDLCDRAVAAMLPGAVDVDATVLLVRTRLLARNRLAQWALAPDPAAVATIRSAVGKQLGDWGLDDVAFTTELIVSELVTNAIRYAGGGPIQVRLIRDRTLTCEVSDTGHTAPNLRHAANDDEGGRGLFIIAQMTHHWGTRYTSSGKTIWTEQDLPQPDRQ
ncbi:ATP-binding SpoIIE family protein phosphatase, partial [Streptomyces sp. A475]|uniref:ATP-binding SpoIIE family protein phosphatase n=1 Tax=Streptomyces sp. A475 TaxID=3131976 RepID=UPI0030C9F859